MIKIKYQHSKKTNAGLLNKLRLQYIKKLIVNNLKQQVENNNKNGHLLIFHIHYYIHKLYLTIFLFFF